MITLPECMQFGQATLTDEFGQTITFTFISPNQLKFTSEVSTVHLNNLENPPQTCYS